MSSNSGPKEYRAVFMLEVMGRPKEHLIKTLEDLIEKINSEKGVTVEEKKIKEPTELEKKKDFFTTFAEIEVKVEELMFLALLMFKYMPSHIELISPENIIVNNKSFSEILNEITRRLHSYEELARVFQIEKSMFEKKIKELEGNKEEKK